MVAGPDTQSPAFDGSVNNIELNAVKDGKILGVSVYSGRAEVTKALSLKIKTGQNQVSVTHLPLDIDQQSFRVEGKGSATIHDVTISRMEDPPAPKPSEKLTGLQAQLTKASKALLRAEKACSSVDKYIKSLDTQHTDVEKFQGILDSYEGAAQKLDDRVTELEETKKQLEKAIEDEKKVVYGQKDSGKLRLKVAIGLFANFEGEVDIVLIYAVHNANWTATYDIRVDIQAKDNPVAVVYKGAITQSTGEDWTDVPIQLETASPTFGVEIPSLSRWTLNVFRPIYQKMAKKQAPSLAMRQKESRGRRLLETECEESSDEDMAFNIFDDATAEVTSKGNITATFAIPGLMSIPSDGDAHNVTIAQLSLGADMEWVAIPKRETKVHLKAIVKNTSEYTFLPGPASIYVDGSFIARTRLPAVSPDETFDCPLGIDPSIRVTYPSVAKKTTQSGFMTKLRVQTFTQRITVHNTKSSTAEKVKIVDQIPVSEDSIIAVKLLSPSLPLVERGAGSGSVGGSSVSKLLQVSTVENKLGVKVPAPVTVSKGVTAQWEGVDDISSEADLEGLGGEGKLGWLCTIPAQGKVNLALQWEVSAPFRTAITGL